jgi:hypothetical protein
MEAEAISVTAFPEARTLRALADDIFNMSRRFMMVRV